MNKKSSIVIAIIVLIVVGGGAFYGGMLYAKSQSAASASAARANFAGRAGRTGVAGAGFTSGSIIAKDSNSITLQLPSSTGGSKIIYYSAATQISKTASGTSADLANGVSVSVTGTTNSDGSVTAQSIQIRPAGINPGGPNIPAQ
jgi:Flp pilus assembly protein TadG